MHATWRKKREIRKGNWIGMRTTAPEEESWRSQKTCRRWREVTEDLGKPLLPKGCRTEAHFRLFF